MASLQLAVRKLLAGRGDQSFAGFVHCQDPVELVSESVQPV
jgi:hypothetical protein